MAISIGREFFLTPGRTIVGFYIKRVIEFNQTKAMPDVMRPDIMHGMGISLVLKFPKLNENEEEVIAEGEENHVAGLNRSSAICSNLIHNPV